MTQAEATELLELFRRDHANLPEIDRQKLAAVYVSVVGSLNADATSPWFAKQPSPPEPADERLYAVPERRLGHTPPLRREPDR